MAWSITAKKRETNTRGSLNALRKSGQIPGVLYGRGMEPQRISVDEGELRKVAETKGLLQVNLGNESHQVMVREIQADPIKARYLHVDFQRVEMNQPITTEIPLVLTGEAVGVKNGGVLEQPIRSIEVRALPNLLPSEATLKISQLDIGDSITLAALTLPDGVELLSDKDTSVASIVPPAKGEETEKTLEPEGEQENE
ncbi:50S ribosomal protein L25 [Laceyella putida]|uniref:Large ribosomal subunit protein bL25 n=1 Tax=Laceyella putida TaxID=110101 RepID=A0ABW2RR85_9BACL